MPPPALRPQVKSQARVNEVLDTRTFLPEQLLQARESGGGARLKGGREEMSPCG